eukprot:959130-Prymnesium_polylepis.1
MSSCALPSAWPVGTAVQATCTPGDVREALVDDRADRGRDVHRKNARARPPCTNLPHRPVPS